jgi:hypothetical protein
MHMTKMLMRLTAHMPADWTEQRARAARERVNEEIAAE